METQARTVTWRYAKGRVEVLQAFLEVVDLGTAHMTIPKIMEVSCVYFMLIQFNCPVIVIIIIIIIVCEYFLATQSR